MITMYNHIKILTAFIVLFSLIINPAYCSSADSSQTDSNQTRSQSDLVLVAIGTEIFSKSKSNQPFLNYLAKQLSDHGIQKGKLKLAEDIYGAAQIIKQGEADLFIDSAYPVLMIRELSGTKLLVRRWKKGVAEYRSVIFTHKDSGINSIGDLIGKRIVFEEPWSTSGFFVPKSVLLDQGFKLKLINSINSMPATDIINYIFSESDEASMVWVLRNRVAAGAIDLPNFKNDARHKVDQLKILHTSEPIPRQLVSYRKDLDPVLVAAIKDVLVNMHQSDEGRKVLKNYKNTKKFDTIPIQSKQLLDTFQLYIDR